MATIPSPPEFTFNPSDTRIKITYKGAPTYAHVPSGAMAQASTVWKNFLLLPWSSNETTSINSNDDDQISTELSKLHLKPVQELDFTDDYAGALLVLLCIAHLKFDDVLNNHQPPRKVLIGLALLCDKCLCQDLFLPRIKI